MKTINTVAASPEEAMATPICYHCGSECTGTDIEENDKHFCCEGCYTVYSLLSEKDLQDFYRLNQTPGTRLKAGAEKEYSFLDDPKVAERFLDFASETHARVTFYIPAIHCSSCIWLLEQLYKFQPGVLDSTVNFPKKQLHLSYDPQKLSLRDVATLIQRLGYPPALNLDSLEKKNDERSKVNRRLLIQLGVAGFCFGNIMLFSFPEYFNLEKSQLPLAGTGFAQVFNWLNLALAIPVVFFSGIDYFKSAFKGLSQKHINMDVPISIGIAVVFLRSAVEIITDTGVGYMDSLAGLVFFLLIGKLFQDKTYHLLSFDRDYKSYFPIAVTRLESEGEAEVSVSELKKGDRIRIRNGELIPADAILIEGTGAIDYSFVTGESDPVPQKSGDRLYAGGRQQGASLEVEVVREVERSYLTRLWNHEAFRKKEQANLDRLSDKVSKWFTFIILGIATIAGVFWLFYDSSLALNVTTAVLIVACPCALALATPFTLGHTLRIFGRNEFYLKGAEVVESLAEIDTIVFDKTGTLTEAGSARVSWHGSELSEAEQGALAVLFGQSTHPMSRSIRRELKNDAPLQVEAFSEEKGKGWSGIADGFQVKAGSAVWVGAEPVSGTGSRVYVSVNEMQTGYFQLEHPLREGLGELTHELEAGYDLYLLSGDSERDRERFGELLPDAGKMHFRQSPEDKLRFIADLQEQGKKVLMMGDGLNDSGALKQSDVGISLTEDITAFTPASDGILGAGAFSRFARLLAFSKTALNIVRASFILSLIYNLIGLGFAVSGQLSPLVAAILMPASSISVVVFTTLVVMAFGRKRGL